MSATVRAQDGPRLRRADPLPATAPWRPAADQRVVTEGDLRHVCRRRQDGAERSDAAATLYRRTSRKQDNHWTTLSELALASKAAQSVRDFAWRNNVHSLAGNRPDGPPRFRLALGWLTRLRRV